MSPNFLYTLFLYLSYFPEFIGQFLQPPDFGHRQAEPCLARPLWGWGGSRPLLDNVQKKDAFLYGFPNHNRELWQGIAAYIKIGDGKLSIYLFETGSLTTKNIVVICLQFTGLSPVLQLFILVKNYTDARLPKYLGLPFRVCQLADICSFERFFYDMHAFH